MELKNHTRPENRRLLPNSAKYVIVAMLLFCAVGGAMAAGNPDPTPTATPDNGADFGVWDIFNKKEIVTSAKNAWSDGLADAGGNLILGICLVVAILSILIVILLGAGVMNFGKFSSDNDTHSKGKEMMVTGVCSAILLVVCFCVVVMVLSGWL